VDKIYISKKYLLSGRIDKKEFQNVARCSHTWQSRLTAGARLRGRFASASCSGLMETGVMFY